ncbi:MAG: NADH-quinone oxidoreductase subunit L [Actinomycetota bacterium]
MIKYSWLIALLPFVSFFLILFFGKRMPGKGAEVGILAVGAGLVMSLLVLQHFVAGGGPYEASTRWFSLRSFKLEIGEYVDGLTAVMLVVVTLVSLCVQVYSIGYMRGDRRYTWYFAALSLFTGSMLNLIIANNLFQLLVGWELVGICSYLLIGHWWEEKENSNAAIKAFITTKTGDIPFLFGIFVLTIAAGTANIGDITHLAEEGEISQVLLTAGALLLFGGAIGKSAQFPLHVWLPDAMAGPTPVSALIHAATMVAAGVYLVGRVFLVFEHASGAALTFVAVIASITMLIAALLALIQDDIKRVLAYSTISQLAYMMAGLSLGPDGYTPGLFHLFTHAFFKALLFLGAGAVIHAVHSNNMSEMGGLRKKLPITFATFLIGSAALMGIPPLAGFWSKDDIITAAWNTENYAVWAACLLTAVLTAFYMTRTLWLTFAGEYRGHAEAHESPRVMTVPLLVLAGFSVVVGFLGAPQFEAVFADWVHHPTEGVHEAVFHYGMAGLSILSVLIGLGIATRLYGTWKARDPLRSLGPVYTVLENKYYLDDFYMRFIVRPIQYKLSAFVNGFNRIVLDGIVHAFAATARGLARGVDAVDRNVVDGAVNKVANLAEGSGGLLKYLQSGNVQRYAAFLFAGVAVLAIVITRI